MTLMQATALEASMPGGTLETKPTLPSRARRSRLGVCAASSEVLPPCGVAGHPDAPSMINTTYFTSRSRGRFYRGQRLAGFIIGGIDAVSWGHEDDQEPSVERRDSGGPTSCCASVSFAYLAMVESDRTVCRPPQLRIRRRPRRPERPRHDRDWTAASTSTAAKAASRTTLAADPRVCLALTAGVTFDQGDRPCEDGFSYRSLLVWGQARRVEDQDGRETALRAIVAKYDPAAAGTAFGEEDFAQTLIYEVIIEAAGYKQQPPRRTD